MQLYNTLTSRKEHYDADTVRMYVCGITPYDTTHLGHALTYVVFDVLARYLEHRGKSVMYVQNITDIDDDIIRESATRGTDWRTLGDENVQRFLEDMDALNIRRPHVMPRAADHIPDIDVINRYLVEKGVAYEAGGSVYFRASQAPFGCLSGLPEDEWLPTANERGNTPDDPWKEHPLDFVLWQGAKPGEPSWDSVFGPGRPGWHVECSAMSMKYLGHTLDIHGGGSDLMFPHHEAEIAQSEAYTDQQFARFWMHVGMLRYQGEKMSKSLGNMVFVSDLLQRHSANAVRMALLLHHYRESWEFTEDEMWRGDRAAEAVEQGGSEEVDVDAERARFVEAMDDDLNTPDAAHALLRLAYGSNRSGEARNALEELSWILGLVL
ncbi:MAG: cysteine--tRNA ligase [Chloroflexota bacterium]